MIKTFVLIWVLATPAGVTSGTAEFIGKATCEAAAEQMLNFLRPQGGHHVGVGCYPKSERGSDGFWD